MSLSKKRPFFSLDGSNHDIMEPHQLKRTKPARELAHTASAGRDTFQHSASVFHRPVLAHQREEQYDHSLEASDLLYEESIEGNFHPWLRSSTSYDEGTSGWQFRESYQNINSSGPFCLNQHWDSQIRTLTADELPGGFVVATQEEGSFLRSEVIPDQDYVSSAAQYGASDDRVNPTESWSGDTSHDALAWTEYHSNFVSQNDFLGTDDSTREPTIPISGPNPTQSVDSQYDLHLSALTPLSRQASRESTDSSGQSSDNLNYSSSDSDNNFQLLDNEPWEYLHTQQKSPGSQPSLSISTSNSDWALVKGLEDLSHSENSTSDSAQWTLYVPNAQEPVKRKQQQRGRFQNKQLQLETSATRKTKACVRCRMQKIRCLPNLEDPTGECRTCQSVTKQKIHKQPCLRYKITECTLYRTGKPPGLEFTLRWAVPKLRDISDWANQEIRTIKLASDICPVPFEVAVRRFCPIPSDTLSRGWMDGKVKKWKEVTPFAIVKMSTAVKDMDGYIKKYVFQSVDQCMAGHDPLVRETFEFARRYMATTATVEERQLLGNCFRLWFAIRRTAITEHIVGSDTIDMKPELTDPTYPLFGKVPVPPVMIQQLDMILTIGFLGPLRKKVLEDFNNMVKSNKHQHWMTIYLVTFMFLHSCSALSHENFVNARKHGLKRRYAMPTFVSELHHASNVFLSHFHYCTKPCNPFSIEWRKRESTPFADMSTEGIHFLVMTKEQIDARKDKIRRLNQQNLYEDDLYFLAQMFEENWTPRDTVIEFHDGTIGDVPTQKFHGPEQ